MNEVIHQNWRISQGKGKRPNIEYLGPNDNGNGLMHPERLEDLAVAISMFYEQEKLESVEERE